MSIRKCFNALAALFVLGLSPALAQNTELLGTARSVLLQSDVVFNKNRRTDPDSKAISFSYIYQSGLMSSFREVRLNPDIIIKFHKDVLLIDYESISLTVFDPDDNSILYTEQRKLVDEANDVNRLVAHFLVKVKAERTCVTEEAAARRKVRAAEIEVEREDAAARHDEKDLKALSDARAVLYFYSSSNSLVQAVLAANRTNPNEYHVYLRNVPSRAKADVILEEKIEEGIYRVTLLARDTKEVLHTEVAPEKSARRAITLMSKWIASTPWE